MAIALCSCGGQPPAAIEVPAVAATDGPPSAAPEKRSEPRRAPPPKAEPPPTSSPDAATAEALFNEGRQLLSQGRVAEACPRFEASYKVDPGVGTLFNLAACEEQLGHVPRACDLFRKAAEVTHARGQQERERVARDRLARLGCPP
jgi:hypothetical protein